ncbi:MAG: hypothetical protein U0167_09710 [bacterium]
MALLLLVFPARSGAVEVVPKVGADFEHFGETYRVTSDQDTVTTIDDYGTVAGVVVRSAGHVPSRFALDLEGYAGHSTRRARAAFDGSLRRTRDLLELHQEAAYRSYTDGGDYTVTRDHFEERARASWEHRLSGSWRLRLRDVFDGTWYADPDAYNLTSWTHEPRLGVGFEFGEGSLASAAYRFAKRDVPDSTTLGYRRHGADAEIVWLFGETTSLDVAETVERRIYEPSSVRESSWEDRVDARLEFPLGERATCRLLNEVEVARFDHPDDLDFDYAWARNGVQLELHGTQSVDVSITPLYTFLGGATSPTEEYTETGLEVGLDWRIGRAVWLSVANEIGRRDYDVNAADTTAVTASSVDPLATSGLDTAFSDYSYDRLTLVFSAEPVPGVSASLFVHWQPESHDVGRDDTATRIVSGGITYAF